MGQRTSQWKKELGSDETRISIFGSDGVRYVCRQTAEDCLPQCTTATMKHPLSIMAWGCMSRDSVGTQACIALLRTATMENCVVCDVVVTRRLHAISCDFQQLLIFLAKALENVYQVLVQTHCYNKYILCTISGSIIKFSVPIIPGFWCRQAREWPAAGIVKPWPWTWLGWSCSDIKDWQYVTEPGPAGLYGRTSRDLSGVSELACGREKSVASCALVVWQTVSQ